MMPLDVSENP